MNLKEIKKLINLVEQASISEFSIETNGTKIDIKKGSPDNGHMVAPMMVQQPVAMPQGVPVASAAPVALVSEEKKVDANLISVTAQMVGTFYTSADPNSAAYVKVGDSISNGQVICIIEAMKLFNEIESDCSGVIEKICIKNGTPVEYGQELFLVRKA
ncbi:MAG: acetyl-CoA carboxylase biotin carboxyl carrier protein [Candidatus Marinamargulisbacteria bacterium]